MDIDMMFKLKSISGLTDKVLINYFTPNSGVNEPQGINSNIRSFNKLSQFAPFQSVYMIQAMYKATYVLMSLSVTNHLP